MVIPEKPIGQMSPCLRRNLNQSGAKQILLRFEIEKPTIDTPRLATSGPYIIGTQHRPLGSNTGEMNFPSVVSAFHLYWNCTWLPDGFEREIGVLTSQLSHSAQDDNASAASNKNL